MLRRFFSRSKSQQDVSSPPSKSMSRSVSDPSMSSPSMSPRSDSRSESPSSEVWTAARPKNYTAAEKKIKDERDLCRKYDSCSDYEDLKRDYLKSFCRTWSTRERRDLERFLDFAREERLVSPDTTLDSIKSLCSLYENTM